MPRRLLVLLHLLFLVVLETGCSEKSEPNEEPTALEPYFPPLSQDQWERIDPIDLEWSSAALDSLRDFLERNNTRAFIVLKSGRIVIESYFGQNISGSGPFERESLWYWASAGKCLSACLVGIAQEEGLLNIEDPSADYLGSGWTSLPAVKERMITIRHQLSMTTGLDYQALDLDCTDPACLTYKADAGQQWYYHNAPYTLLRRVVENASQLDYNRFTQEKLGIRIGMGGRWLSQGSNNPYWSTARDMARFALLMLNDGRWGDEEILKDRNFVRQMTNPSQNLNPSYGFLWWLNGQNSIIYPGFSQTIGISLAPDAPSDLVVGMGKNGQFMALAPSQDLVVIRLGEAPDQSLVPISFHNQMWIKLQALWQ